MMHNLRLQLVEPRHWSRSLGRLSFARNIQGSCSIEGFDAPLDDAAAVALGEDPSMRTLRPDRRSRATATR